jgi:Bacterial regulatory proteins, lacI family
VAKRTTAREVAERAGVSSTTVSFVLNDVAGMRISQATRQRVLRAASQMDYHPDAIARLMVTGQAKVLGFGLQPGPRQALADKFVLEMLRGLSHNAARRAVVRFEWRSRVMNPGPPVMGGNFEIDKKRPPISLIGGFPVAGDGFEPSTSGL